jgi:hypothetical protein
VHTKCSTQVGDVHALSRGPGFFPLFDGNCICFQQSGSLHSAVPIIRRDSAPSSSVLCITTWFLPRLALHGCDAAREMQSACADVAAHQNRVSEQWCAGLASGKAAVYRRDKRGSVNFESRDPFSSISAALVPQQLQVLAGVEQGQAGINFQQPGL